MESLSSYSHGLAPRLADNISSHQSIFSRPQSQSSVFSISGCCKLPSSAFFASEKCFNFPRNDDCIESLPSSIIDSTNEENLDPVPKAIIESDDEFSFHSNQSPFCFDKSARDCLTRMLEHQNGVGGNMFSSPIVEPITSSDNLKKELTKPSYEIISVTSKCSAPKQAFSRKKRRIQWTQHLHDQFIQCVNLLGGPARATPNGILKLMGVNGLTILHVKSHLQKYRESRYIPEFAEGKSERAIVNSMPHLNPKLGMQIMEALRVQIEAQKIVHEQLKIQRKLLLRIEKQGKQLKRMLSKQEKQTSPSFFERM